MAEKYWLDILETKRASQYSPVVFVESNDVRRYEELVVRFRDREPKRKLWMYDTFAGLRDGTGKPVMEPPAKGGLGLLKQGDPIDEINKELTKPLPNRELSREELYDLTDQVVVIKNILDARDVPMKAVNYWSAEDEALAYGRILVIFVPDRGLVDQRVLEKCTLIVPPLSLPHERKRILRTLRGMTFGQPLVDVDISSMTEQEMLDRDLYAYKDKGTVKVRKLMPLAKDKAEALVTLTAGLDLNQTEATILETLREYNLTGNLDLAVVSKTKAAVVEKSGLLQVIEPKYGFEGVGGYDAVKDYIIESVINPLREPDRAKELGVEPPRGAIIFGPPGTGKTILTKAMGYAMDYPVIALNPENFLGGIVGQSESNLRKVFAIIEASAPCLVLMDEIDRYGSRGGPKGELDGGVQGRTFSQILGYLGDENRKAFVVGTTNVPELDEAFRREGRFDVMIPMLSPDLEARLAILKIHLNVRRKVKHSLSEVVLQAVAARTRGWKGNMLEELVKRATRAAFNESKDTVTDQVLMATLDDYRANIKDLDETEETYIDQAKRFCNSQRFLDQMMQSTVIAEGQGRSEGIRRQGRETP